MPFTNQTEEKQIERAVLVGLSCPSFNTDQDADERTMDELRALAETAGAEAVAMTLQRRPAPDARTFIGEGKAEEVKQLAEMNDASLILFDNELSPSQMSNLEELTGRTVLDRSALILDIFAQRARTGEGKLQVELAQYQYILPRLAGMGKAMSRLGAASARADPVRASWRATAVTSAAASTSCAVIWSRCVRCAPCSAASAKRPSCRWLLLSAIRTRASPRC